MGLWNWLTGRNQHDNKREERARPAVVVTATVRRRPSPPHLAKRPTVYGNEYLPRDREEQSFVLDANGMPTGRLRRERDRLVIITDDGAGMVNPSSARLHTLGLYCFRIRGVTFHVAAVKSGDFHLGTPVRLVREPNNQHDPNAIGVYASGARRPAGYVNKQNARRLAKRLDAGEKYAAISVRGDRPGVAGPAPWVLVAAPDVLAHLQRRVR